MKEHDPLREEFAARLSRMVPASVELDHKVVFYQLGVAAAKKEKAVPLYRTLAMVACWTLGISTLIYPFAYRSGERAAEARTNHPLTPQAVIVMEPSNHRSMNSPVAPHQDIDVTRDSLGTASFEDDLLMAGVIGRNALNVTSVVLRPNPLAESTTPTRDPAPVLSTTPLSPQQFNDLLNL